MGINVILSDVDVIWLYDPFPFLHKDTDVRAHTPSVSTPLDDCAAILARRSSCARALVRVDRSRA